MDHNNIQVFEELAAAYDGWFALHPFAYESELQALKEFIPPRGQGLEIGAGSGRFAVPLGLRLGVEPARAMARLARNRGLKVLQSYAEALPFKEQAFDFILLVTVLCFLSDPPGALGEATRVLKPGGRIIIAMIDPDSPLGRAYEKDQEKSRFYRQARFHPVGQVLAWLETLGYLNLETRQTIFQNPATLTAPDSVDLGHGAGAFVVIAGQKSQAVP
jgi:SAM-dependent methyltransferase